MTINVKQAEAERRRAAAQEAAQRRSGLKAMGQELGARLSQAEQERQQAAQQRRQAAAEGCRTLAAQVAQFRGEVRGEVARRRAEMGMALKQPGQKGTGEPEERREPSATAEAGTGAVAVAGTRDLGKKKASHQRRHGQGTPSRSKGSG